MKLVYAHNGQSPAAGKREVWIDANGDWFLLTGSFLAADGTIITTKRALMVEPSANQPPAGGNFTLAYEVPSP